MGAQTRWSCGASQPDDVRVEIAAGALLVRPELPVADVPLGRAGHADRGGPGCVRRQPRTAGFAISSTSSPWIHARKGDGLRFFPFRCLRGRWRMRCVRVRETATKNKHCSSCSWARFASSATDNPPAAVDHPYRRRASLTAVLGRETRDRQSGHVDRLKFQPLAPVHGHESHGVHVEGGRGNLPEVGSSARSTSCATPIEDCAGSAARTSPGSALERSSGTATSRRPASDRPRTPAGHLAEEFGAVEQVGREKLPTPQSQHEPLRSRSRSRASPREPSGESPGIFKVREGRQSRTTGCPNPACRQVDVL